MLSKFIHVVANGKILSFLWLHNILSHTHTHTHTYMYVYVCMCAKSFQSCTTIWNPMHCSPPDSSVHRILQARILEWIAMPSSRESSQPRDGTWIFKSPALAGGFFTASATWEAYIYLYIYNIYLYIYIYILLYITYTHLYTTSSLSIYLLIDTSCFHVLAIVNSAALNFGVAFWISGFGVLIYSQEWNC